MERFVAVIVAILLACLTCTPAVAQLRGSKVTEEAVGGDLTASIRSAAAPADSHWIAWEVPSNDPQAFMCCSTTIDRKGEKPARHGGVCSLVHEGASFSNFGGDEDEVAETRKNFSIFLHVEAGNIDRIRLFSEDCVVDADGARVVHLTGVAPEDSVRYLATLANALPDGEEHGGQGGQMAIAAIALHRSANMVSTLEGLMKSAAAEKTRAHAAFWLGMRGGAPGIALVRQAIDTSDSRHFREQAIVGIAQSHEKEALDVLMAMARSHPAPDVRKQAIFWLAQRAGTKVSAELAQATDDPDQEVREMAVFAISQLPAERAVPELIQLTRSNKSRAVRERAMFWLGQSSDPRALDFIEEVLLKKN